MLILLGDALGFGKDSDTRVTSFTCIDEIITCQEPTCIDKLNLVNRQVHVLRHSLTCRKNTKSGCQFNYPQPPTRQAQMLLPQDSDNMPQNEVKKTDGNQSRSISVTYQKLMIKVQIIDQLLLHLTCSVIEEKFLLAINWAPLNALTVVLKRNPNELHVFINNYNPACLIILGEQYVLQL